MLLLNKSLAHMWSLRDDFLAVISDPCFCRHLRTTDERMWSMRNRHNLNSWRRRIVHIIRSQYPYSVPGESFWIWNETKRPCLAMRFAPALCTEKALQSNYLTVVTRWWGDGARYPVSDRRRGQRLNLKQSRTRWWALGRAVFIGVEMRFGQATRSATGKTGAQCTLCGESNGRGAWNRGCFVSCARLASLRTSFTVRRGAQRLTNHDTCSSARRNNEHKNIVTRTCRHGPGCIARISAVGKLFLIEHQWCVNVGYDTDCWCFSFLFKHF
jgi:hypothetical protein